MNPLEIIGLTIVGCSAFYVPSYILLLNRERKIVETQKMQMTIERRQFFNAIQEKASANATLPCRTCCTCKRVVHRYRREGEGYICRECDIT